MAFLQLSHPLPPGMESAQFELTGERVVIGRSAEADLYLADSQVSRVHVLVERLAATWWATDRSSNGTFVDGRPLRGQIRLRHGMRLQIGHYRLRFADPGEQTEATAAAGKSVKRLTEQEHAALVALCRPLAPAAGPFPAPATVQEIMRVMHLSKSRVEQLLNAAQRKLVTEGDMPLNRLVLANAAINSGEVDLTELQ